MDEKIEAGQDQSKFTIPGVTVSLNLAEQRYGATAAGYLKPLSIERDGSFILPPYHESPRPVLAMTRERVHLKPGSRLAARVEGRSSLARIGLMVHLTAPIIHANFNAPITLEMINHGPFLLKLVPGKTRICQLIVERLETEPVGDIRTEFQHQTSPAGKRNRFWTYEAMARPSFGTHVRKPPVAAWPGNSTNALSACSSTT
jgi:dCTP deaminase